MEVAMARISHFEAEVESDEQDASVLLSIGDLMSGLLMFFALLFVTAMVQLKEVEKQQRIFIGTLVGQLKGNNVDVMVDPEKGDVSIREAILFDEGSAVLKPEGEAFLQQFIPVYSQVIFSQPVFDQQVARVVIEGHTSSKGSPEANLELSLARSLAVSKYVLSSQLEFPSKPQLINKIMSAGRGEVEANQIEDIAADRKVLFRFQFRGKELSE
jgi:outer membrane protein OmpA-like peptidoglycan-associated protein